MVRNNVSRAIITLIRYQAFEARDRQGLVADDEVIA
jgi:hypothetical protein